MKIRFILGAVVCCLGFAAQFLCAGDSTASVLSELHQLSIDPAQTYHVRELQIARGDIKIYLTEGVLAFAKPVNGRTVAAVFTTADTEAGDGEVLVLPPTRSERASLARFAKTPNLDEHFASAVFFFSDETAKELRSQMDERPLHPALQQGQELAASVDDILRADAGELDVRMAESLLDNHAPGHGFFYGIVGGRNLGAFDVIYEPTRAEPVLLGRLGSMDDRRMQFFQVWCSFRPRRRAPVEGAPHNISDYHVDTVIHADLSMVSRATFQYRASAEDGRAIPLELSTHLRVTAAQIDGKRAEFLQHDITGFQVRGGAPLLLVASEPLTPEISHRVELSYEGSVVFRTDAGNYFVDERNTWYPFIAPMLTTFDLTFHCPENLRVVATGEMVSDEVAAGVRTVHRKTDVPVPLAGFNLGNYEMSSIEHGGYRIELFANRLEGSARLPEQAASILDYYSARWLPLGLHSIAISPVEGYFGQGFPGMIYLSSISYLREEDRPASLRNTRLDSFFSEMLLPHEIAHQWWGNMASPSDYRSDWLFEAMSSYSALEFLEESKGRAALDDVMESYRQDLIAGEKGVPLESAGPVDFGERLLDNDGMRAWHVIIYEKGAWILHMLRMRLGDEPFHSLQTKLLSEFQNKLVTNEDFRRLAASFVPEDQTDKTLNAFFDNWVYATGIPKMAFRGTGSAVTLKISGVDDGFALDLPLRCSGPDGTEQVVWVHAGAGDNSFEMANGNHSCRLPKQADYLYQ